MVIQDYPVYSPFYKELSFCWLFGGLVPTVRDPDLLQAQLLVREVSEEGKG